MNIKKLTTLALLLSISLILYRVELLLDFSFGIPGVKIGLSNIITLLILVLYGFKDSILVLILRIIMVSFLFGNLFSLMYSLSAGIVSLTLMHFSISLFKDKISIIGISIIGAYFHSLTQIFVASVLIDNINIFYYLPILTLVSLFSGIIIGFITSYFDIFFRKYLIPKDTNIH